MASNKGWWPYSHCLDSHIPFLNQYLATWQSPSIAITYSSLGINIHLKKIPRVTWISRTHWIEFYSNPNEFGFA